MIEHAKGNGRVPDGTEEAMTATSSVGWRLSVLGR